MKLSRNDILLQIVKTPRLVQILKYPITLFRDGLPQIPGFASGSVHVGLVEKVALGQVFLRVHFTGRPYLYIMWVMNNRSVGTERHGRVVNSPASYPGGPVLESHSGNQLFWLSFCGFSQSLQADSGIIP
jgi:hypothetical protein